MSAAAPEVITLSDGSDDESSPRSRPDSGSSASTAGDHDLDADSGRAGRAGPSLTPHSGDSASAAFGGSPTIANTSVILVSPDSASSSTATGRRRDGRPRSTIVLSDSDDADSAASSDGYARSNPTQRNGNGNRNGNGKRRWNRSRSPPPLPRSVNADEAFARRLQDEQDEEMLREFSREESAHSAHIARQAQVKRTVWNGASRSYSRGRGGRRRGRGSGGGGGGRFGGSRGHRLGSGGPGDDLYDSAEDPDYSPDMETSYPQHGGGGYSYSYGSPGGDGVGGGGVGSYVHKMLNSLAGFGGGGGGGGIFSGVGGGGVGGGATVAYGGGGYGGGYSGGGGYGDNGVYPPYRGGSGGGGAAATEESLGSYEELLALDDTIKKKGLDKAAIGRFTSEQTLTKEDIGNLRDSSCVICLDDFRPKMKIRRLPCLCCFHVKCIDKYLKNATNCPICRAEVQGGGA